MYREVIKSLLAVLRETPELDVAQRLGKSKKCQESTTEAGQNVGTFKTNWKGNTGESGNPNTQKAGNAKAPKTSGNGKKVGPDSGIS